MLQEELKRQISSVAIPFDPILNFSEQAIKLTSDCRLEVERLITHISIALENLYIEKDSFVNSNYIPPHLVELFKNSRTKLKSHPNFRIDCIYNPKEGALKLIEINSADPSGFGLTDYLYAQTNQPFDSILLKYKSYLMNSYKNLSRIVTVIEDTSFVRNDFVLLQHLFKNDGIHLEIFDPSKVTDVVLENCDLVIRDYLDEVVTSKGIINRALYDYYNSERPLMNPVGSLLGDLKAVLPFVESHSKSSAPETQIHFLNSRAIDSVQDLLRNRQNIVLKKSYSYGGTGVYIGKYTDVEMWAKIVQTACSDKKNWMIQDHYEPLNSSHRFETVSFWAIDGKHVGSFGRRSSEPVVNVNRYGQLVPVDWEE